MKKSIILLSVFSSIMISCSNSSGDEIGDPEGNNCNPNISYSKVIRPLIDQKCGNCHLDGSQSPDLTTYNSVKMNAEAIKDATQTGRMPKNGSLTKSQKEAIACWVDSGAKNN